MIPDISPNTARSILQNAKRNGVTVEAYLKKISEETAADSSRNSRCVRRAESKVDLSESRKWLIENRHKFIGQWVVLDGDRLVGAGADPLPFVERARTEGVKAPFMQFLADDSEPFTGGWL